MEVAAFDPAWMWELIDGMAGRHVSGGRSYDAFIAEILCRSQCTAIATFNSGHFASLSPLSVLDPNDPAIAG